MTFPAHRRGKNLTTGGIARTPFLRRWIAAVEDQGAGAVIALRRPGGGVDLFHVTDQGARSTW